VNDLEKKESESGCRYSVLMHKTTLL
jgi:hypothetical protein